MFQLKQNYLLICTAIFLCATIQINAQNCDALKTGIFYSYPKNSSDKYLIKRSGDFQYEKDINSGDSIVYKIEWLKNCTYKLKFISSNAKMSAEDNDFWQKHNLLYEITSSTPFYYTYKGYIDKTSNISISSDTMWLKEKLNVTSNELILSVKSEVYLKKSHFSDTSKYAILYLYRTGKFAASAVDMLIYFDNNLICDSKNGSTFIFKIMKEGNYELSSVSNMNKKSADLPLKIKFGQKYYVNSSAKFAVNILSEYVPTLKLVDANEGEEEFQNAY